ncbi:MAG TPA: hypothetical protein DCZ62_05030 [Ruminococcus sp.]|nr:hypothetical protein [Ruminococcus sp.]
MVITSIQIYNKYTTYPEIKQQPAEDFTALIGKKCKNLVKPLQNPADRVIILRIAIFLNDGKPAAVSPAVPLRTWR